MGSRKLTVTMRTLIALSLAISAIAAQGPLPNYMLGDFQLETSEGFEDYMYEIGVNWFTRKIACTLYPTARNSITPDGKIMTLIHTMPNNPKIKSVRVYKRQ